MNLQKLQSNFQQIVLDKECVGAEWVDSSAQDLSSQDRLAIYHNAYRVRLIDVLLDTFEHTAIYLGDDWFHQLASNFVQSNHSTHNNIGLYGQSFPVFLKEQLADDLEVSELALMDWKLRRAFDGADSTIMTFDHLQLLASGKMQSNDLLTVPTLSITKQYFNTLEIWQAINQDETPPTVEALSEPIELLIWRKGQSPHFRSLSKIEAATFGYIGTGNTLDAIGSKLEENFPEIDAATEFGIMLQRWIGDQTLTFHQE